MTIRLITLEAKKPIEPSFEVLDQGCSDPTQISTFYDWGGKLSLEGFSTGLSEGEDINEAKKRLLDYWIAELENELEHLTLQKTYAEKLLEEAKRSP